MIARPPHRGPYKVDLAPIHLLRRRYCLFVGAGFSAAAAGYKSVSELQELLLAEIPSDFGATRADPLSLLAEAFHDSRTELLKIIREHFGRTARGPLSNETSRLLTDVPWRAIYTTNYDTFIEDKLAEAGIAARVVSRNSDISRLRNYEVPVYKLHGSTDELNLDRETPIVISESDYLDERYWRNRELLFHRLRADLTSFPILFIGYSITDENIRRLWTTLFANVVRVTTECSITTRPVRFYHIAISRDPAPIAEHFWNSYGVQMRAQDIHEFAIALLDYQDKAFAGTNSAYFDEREFLLALRESEPCAASHGPLPLRVDDFHCRLAVLSELSFSDPKRMVLLLLTTATRDGVYLASALAGDLKLDLTLRAHVASALDQRLQIDLALESGQATELTVSALLLVWDDLAEDSQADWADRLVTLFDKADKLTLYKIAQVALELNHPSISRKIFRFCEEHSGDDSGDLLDPLCESSVSRMLRQITYSLVSISSDDVAFDSSLIVLFEKAKNPIIAWEIGAVVAARCLWHRTAQVAVTSWLGEANVRELYRAVYLFARVPEFVRKRLEGGLQDRLFSATAEIGDAFQANHYDSSNLFQERVAFWAAARNAKTCQEWIAIAEPYLRAAVINDFTSYPVLLTLPVTSRSLPTEERTAAYRKMIEIAPKVSYIAQPAIKQLCDEVLDHPSSVAFETLETSLNTLREHGTFHRDEWGRFVCVRALGSMLDRHTAALPPSTLKLCRDVLIESIENPGERLTIAAAAYFGLQSNRERR